MGEFFSERTIKATRRRHFCEGCGRQMEAGLPATYFATMQEGEFYAGHYHTECRAAEIAWNFEAETWGDEYASLSSIRDCDEFADWRAWLRENHPIAAGRVSPDIAA